MARRARKREAVDKPAQAAARAPSAKGRQSARNPGPAPKAPVEEISGISSKEFASWAAALLFLYSFIATWGQFEFGNLMGYYSMLADALLSGRLSIDYTPDEVHLIDMIPFEGRYYLQWGPVPALFHLIAKLGGGELTDRVACILAGWLTSLAFLRINLTIRGRYFPKLPLWVCRAFFVAFALGSPTAFVSLRGTIYHESIGMTVNAWRWPAAAVLVYSAILHIHLSFTQPFFTPPPDPSAMKAFVKWGPVARGLFDWPQLAKDEAVVRNDLGVHYLQGRRHADALEQFEVANQLLPGSPVVEKNLNLTRALLRQTR